MEGNRNVTIHHAKWLNPKRLSELPSNSSPSPLPPHPAVHIHMHGRARRGTLLAPPAQISRVYEQLYNVRKVLL